MSMASMICSRSTAIFSLFVLGWATKASAEPLSPDGHWQGVMEREGAVMTVRFDFQTKAGAVSGRFTSEAQRALEYPLDGVSYSVPKIHWTLGDSLVFDGVVSSQSIDGTFKDGQAKGTFSLKPVKLDAPPYRREDITFRNGAVVLSGTLLRPKSAGLHPGVVFLHGSGPESRWGTSLFLADRFARMGIAALVFDKRGVGQSTGDWKTITYQVLTEDYLAGVHFLAGQPGVNPKQVGIYGHSQGGTISPMIASRPGAVAFVIAAAAIGTGPLYEQDLYRTRNELLDDGLPEPELSRAMDLYTRWLNVARTGEGWDELDRAVAEEKNEKWFTKLGLPLSKDNWLYKWYPPVGSFNPLPLWEQVKVPVLLIYGERDTNTPVAPSIAGIGLALRKAGNTDFTPLIIPGAAHNLTIRWQSGGPFFWWYAAPGYSDLLTSWVRLRYSGK
jgi:uncharacterized protein